MTTADMVRSKGFRVVEASTAAEALNLVGERSVAAVVTDIRMPGMNGLELSRHVRRIQPEMPLVFVSGEAHVDAAHLPPGSFFVSKPINLHELVLALFRALGAIGAT